MLTVKPVYKLSDVSDDLKWATNIHVTPFTLTFKAKLTISIFLEDCFSSVTFLPVHLYFYPSTLVFTHPNDRWTGPSIKLCHPCKDYHQSITVIKGNYST